MNAKRKIIIAVCAFALIVVATVVSVIAVLAAQNVTINNSVNVTYEVNDVLGYTKTSYKYAGDSTYTAWLAETDLTTTITTQSKTFTGFTASKQYVIIKFEFKKAAATNENYKAVLNYASTSSNNVTITSGTSESAITTAAAAKMFDVTISSADYTAYYVKIAINSSTNDASFAGTFNWTLTNIDG